MDDPDNTQNTENAELVCSICRFNLDYLRGQDLNITPFVTPKTIGSFLLKQKKSLFLETPSPLSVIHFE